MSPASNRAIASAICLRSFMTTGKAASTPGALADLIRKRAPSAERIGFETGAMASWLWHELAGLAFRWSDRCATCSCRPFGQDEQERQERRARFGGACPYRLVPRGQSQERGKPESAGCVLAVRSRLVGIRRDIENQVRSFLKEYGLLFSRAIGAQFRQSVRELLETDQSLMAIVEPLLSIHEHVASEQAKLDAEVRPVAHADETVQRLMSVPGVGVVTALTFRHTIDDPTRFGSAAKVGAYLGLTSSAPSQIFICGHSISRII